MNLIKSVSLWWLETKVGGAIDLWLGTREHRKFLAWQAKGIKADWVTPLFCHTHEGDPYMDEEEYAEWEEGGDPCLFVMKLK